MPESRLSPSERRAVLSLAGIFGLRLLGLFMIYPVFALYARSLPDATPARVGLALGIYGLAQALLQIPLGLLSDRIGRKRVIAAGLVVFALGSAVAALAHTLELIALGRFLQGVGAIGSALLALAADLTRAENRGTAMAVIGLSIGFAFGLALLAGPILNGLMGVPGMFWLTAVFGALGLVLLYIAVPTPVASKVHEDAEAVPALLGGVLREPRLLRLDFAILVQHAILTATFLGVPLVLEQAGIAAASQWRLYLPALLVSALTVFPLVRLAERPGRLLPVLMTSIAVIGAAQALFLFPVLTAWGAGAALVLFFGGFNLLEALLPALISRVAPAGARGTAMGVYSSAQFLGIFLGGVLGGAAQGRFGPAGSFGFSLGMAAIWLLGSWLLPFEGTASTPHSR
ncbi:MAG TPA: MFS transporter [Gammaproteobacteria bacterium]|nr:MFS transporter [Gammaproteobacteria bacterium]